jgi:hypothetical protein
MEKGALQRAKLEMIRVWTGCFFARLWAGFIMVGESRRSLNPIKDSEDQ